MEFTASQIADLLNGTIEGDPSVKVSQFSKIEEAGPNALTFLANPAYTPYIYKTKAAIVLVSDAFEPDHPLHSTLIRVADPYSALAKLLEFYRQQMPQKSGISSLAFISNSASLNDNPYIGEFAFLGENVKVGKNVRIYPHCYIGDNVSIGDNVTMFSGVRIYENCQIGNDCTIHSNAVIGADGFGFAPQSDSNYQKIAQIGNVIIEDYVEIGAGTTIDRATMGSTVIRRGVKLDNLIQVAHNVVIGENTVIAAQTGIAGSSQIGKNCMIGGQVGISGHLTLGDGVKIAAQTGVSASIKNDQTIMGSPAMDAARFRRSFIYFRNLESLVKRLDELEKALKAMEGNG